MIESSFGSAFYINKFLSLFFVTYMSRVQAVEVYTNAYIKLGCITSHSLSAALFQSGVNAR